MLEWVQEGEGGLAEGRCVRRGGTGLVSGVQEADAKRGCGNMNGKVSKVGARSVGADVRLVSSRIVWDNTKIACTCACVCVCVCVKGGRVTCAGDDAEMRRYQVYRTGR